MPKVTYETAMAEELDKIAPPCVVCEHPARAAIESDRESGKSYRMIARALKRIGAYPDAVSLDTATNRVGKHFNNHTEKKE